MSDESTEKVIAVVNNDRTFLGLMNRLLSEEGYKTSVWTQREGAYEFIKQEQPDLVILDIVMEEPEAGWTVLELLRLDPSTAEIPVIVCSADHQTLVQKEELLSRLRSDVLEKPFDLQTMIDMVQRVIGPPSPPVSGEK